MTIIIVSKDSLVTDDIGTTSGVGTRRLKYSNVFDSDEREYFACGCGDNATIDQIIGCWIDNQVFRGNPRNSYAFVYDIDACRSYYLLAHDGHLISKVPVSNEAVQLWGDGQDAFVQALRLLGRGYITPSNFNDVLATLWFEDTSRVDLVPTFYGYEDGIRLLGVSAYAVISSDLDFVALSGDRGVSGNARGRQGPIAETSDVGEESD